jgi:hypothetical protein
MRRGLRGRVVRGTLVAAGAAIALVGVACSKTGPVTCGTCLMYSDNCDASAVTWQGATGDPRFQPILQKMVAGGCSTPLTYTPCKDHHCNSGKEAADAQFISMCPLAVAQSAVESGERNFSIIAPGPGGTDRCTGVPPKDWAIVMWPPSWIQPFPGKCPTANCA